MIFDVPGCIIGGDIRARFDGSEPPHKRLVRKKLGYGRYDSRRCVGQVTYETCSKIASLSLV